MLNKAIGKPFGKITAGGGLAILLILISIGYGYAVYRVQRPITDTGGAINQTYLWAENGHKGVDFTYPLDTDVYAVAGGTVVDLREDLNDGNTSTDWGNFVLVRHDQYHFDRTYGTFGTLAYVYSMYLHLSKDSVRVQEGNHVSAGDWIAEVDDTGAQSSGHHLHLQIVIHPLPNRTLEPFTLDSENRSRNPELWLTPFDFGSDETGTVIGRVSDANGDPVSDLRIYGLTKPAAAGGNVYQWSQTYSYAWANPDDVLVENFGTTDVAPGSYHVVAKQLSGGQWQQYRDLGWHTVEAGKTTYVGLYPVYQPDVRGNYEGWNATTTVWNNNTTRRAEVNTTFFHQDGLAWEQRVDDVAPQSTVSFSPSPISVIFSPLTAASEDIAVVVENHKSSNGQSYSYNGIAAADSLNPGWGQVGTNIHLPLLMDNNNGWSTQVTILNAGGATASLDLDYFAQGNGGSWQGPTGNLAPGASVTYPQAGSTCPTVGAGRVTSNQPLAVMVQQFHSGGVSAAYDGFGDGATTVNLPLIMANNSGWWTGIAVQNLSSANTAVTVHYDPQPGYPSRYSEGATVAPHRTVLFLQTGGQWGSAPWIGSARVVANQPLAAIVNQNYSGRLMSYDGFLDGTGHVVLPIVRNAASGWTSGVQVQNLDSATADVVLRVGGSQTWSGSIGAHKSVTFYPVPGTGAGFTGPATVACTNGRRIAAVVNTTRSGTGDYIRCYNGLNR